MNYFALITTIISILALGGVMVVWLRLDESRMVIDDLMESDRLLQRTLAELDREVTKTQSACQHRVHHGEHHPTSVDPVTKNAKVTKKPRAKKKKS